MQQPTMKEIGLDNRIIGLLEADKLKKSRDKIYIALEEVDFIWSKKEAKEFDFLYKKGLTLKELASHFERPEIDILLLALSRIKEYKIPVRKGWRLT